MDVQTEQKILLSPRQAAALLSIGERTLWRWTFGLHLLPAVKVGYLTRYRREDLEQFGQNLRQVVPVSRPRPKKNQILVDNPAPV